jgi:Putative metallopeptidase
MRSRFLRRQQILSPLLFVLLFALLSVARPVFAQPAPAQAATVQAKIDTAAAALEKNPRFKGLSPAYRQVIAEFVAGNSLFVLLHEMAHAATSELPIPAPLRKEDAADSFAVAQLVKLNSGFPDRVLEESARGWFLSDQRGQENGDPIQYYDEHGLGQDRAYRIVCLLVGTGEDKYRRLISATKLPADHQENCAGDFNAASNAWEMALKPYLRSPDQPKTKINVVYGDAKGKLEAVAQALRSMALLETVAERMADAYTWPAPFTIELQSCGFSNAQWLPRTHKLAMCYELASDFGDLYRGYGDRPASSETRKPRTR